LGIFGYLKFINRPGAIEALKDEYSRSQKFGLKAILKYFWNALSIFYFSHVLDKFYSKEKHPIIFYSYWLNSISLASLFIKNDFVPVLICRGHRYDLYEELYSPPYIPFQKQLIKFSIGIFTISSHGNNMLINKYPECKDKIFLSRLGVQDGGGICKPSNDGVFRIVTCSSLISRKRVDKILRAVETLDFSVQWVHFGDGELRKEFIEIANNFPKNLDVRFPGNVKNHEILNHYETFPVDIFINCSESEGLPVSIMEAMSFGIPILAADVDGNCELVGNDNGFLFKKDISPENLRDLIVFYRNLKNSDKQEKRDNSYKKWQFYVNQKEQYSKFVKKIKEIY
jgi:glycosyltransferase involved in cell wall biosynthesis